MPIRYQHTSQSNQKGIALEYMVPFIERNQRWYALIPGSHAIAAHGSFHTARDAAVDAIKSIVRRAVIGGYVLDAVLPRQSMEELSTQIGISPHKIEELQDGKSRQRQLVVGNVRYDITVRIYRTPERIAEAQNSPSQSAHPPLEQVLTAEEGPLFPPKLYTQETLPIPLTPQLRIVEDKKIKRRRHSSG